MKLWVSKFPLWHFLVTVHLLRLSNALPSPCVEVVSEVVLKVLEIVPEVLEVAPMVLEVLLKVLEVALYTVEVVNGVRCVLWVRVVMLCMLEAVEGELRSLEVLE